MMLTIIMLSLVSSCSKNEIKEDLTTNDKYKNNDIKIVLSDSYIEDSKSYIFSNGIVLVEKIDSVKGIIIAVDSIDTNTSEWSKDQSYMIYCDSTYMPIMAKNSQFIFYFMYDNNRKLIDVSLTDINGNNLSSNYKVPYMKTKRVSTEGWTAGDDLGAALELYDNINTAYNPTKSNISSTVASWFIHLLPEGIPQDIASLSISLIDALKGGKAGLLGIILNYPKLIQDIGENRAKSLIGDCTPYIQSVSKEGSNSAIINLEIEGVSKTTPYSPYYIIKYWQEINGKWVSPTYYTQPLKAENGTKAYRIDNLNGGCYAFQLLLFPSLFLDYIGLSEIYNFRSNIQKINIAKIYIESIKQESIRYKDGGVKADMIVNLGFPSEQDKTILSYYEDYGVCVSHDYYGLKNESYYSARNIDKKNLNISLELRRDEFTCDYSSFIATCSNNIRLKTYTIDGWGIKEFHDEKIPNITYDKKPSISHSNARITSCVESNRKKNKDGTYNIQYRTSASIDWTDEGAFWMDYAFRRSSDSEDLSQFAPYDGTGTVIYNWQYWSNNFHDSDYWYVINLTNGQEMRSSTTIRFTGPPDNPSISIY